MDPLEAAVKLGKDTEALRENPALGEVVSIMRQDAISRWANSPVQDQAGRESSFYVLQAIKAFEAAIETLVGRGNAARNKLAQKANK